MSARSLSTEKTAGPFRTLRRLAFRGVTRLVSAFRELWGVEHPSRRASLFRIRTAKTGDPARGRQVPGRLVDQSSIGGSFVMRRLLLSLSVLGAFVAAAPSAQAAPPIKHVFTIVLEN